MLQSALISFSMYTHMHAHTHAHTNSTNKKWYTSLCRNFTCPKRAQGTSGYWILTMKLQKLHSNEGDEVRRWDGNHKLILVSWQVTRPWLTPKHTSPPPRLLLRWSRKIHRVEEIIDSLLISGHGGRSMCLIVVTCDTCTWRKQCNLGV